jgi:hypothetical protein
MTTFWFFDFHASGKAAIVFLCAQNGYIILALVKLVEKKKSAFAKSS